MTDSQLNMLTQREQLMEDIDCIIESHFAEVEYKPAHGTDLVYITDELIHTLCDAVCKNFPINSWTKTTLRQENKSKKSTFSGI